MLPSLTKVNIANLDEVIEPSLTYGLDLKQKRVIGLVNNQQSVLQAVTKMLNTEKYAYVIYKTYGVSLENLIGKDYDYIKSVIKQRIEDSLLSDNRIKEIVDFDLSKNKDKLIISFRVNSIEGYFSIEQEVEL